MYELLTIFFTDFVRSNIDFVRSNINGEAE